MSDDLLLIRRQRPIGDPVAVGPMGASPVAWYEGTAASGRLAHLLAEAAFDLETVTQLALHPDVTPEQLADVDLRRRFDVVVLGSHHVNTPDDDRRRALLDLVRRHLVRGGIALVEHHPVDWAETAAEVRPVPGAEVGMVDVRPDPPFVHAVTVYDLRGRLLRQPFTARVLSDQELADGLHTAGFHVTRRLSPTLIEAVPAGA